MIRVLLLALVCLHRCLCEQQLGENIAPIDVPASSYSTVKYYKFNAESFHPSKLFRNIYVKLNFPNVSPHQQSSNGYDYTVQRNTNSTALEESMQHLEQAWLPSFGLRQIQLFRQTHINPFETTHVAVYTKEAYTISLDIRQVDLVYVCLFGLCILVFFTAEIISRNAAFYYGSGVTIGLLGSVLLVVWLLHRLLPKRTFGLTFLAGGWSLCVYLLYWCYDNVYALILEHRQYVATYIVTISLISFAVVYRLGPPKNPRTLNLLCWLLQGMCCVGMYNFCQSVQVSLAVIAACLIIYNTPMSWIVAAQRTYFRYFPPARRLLSEEEFNRESAMQTQKALNELRSFCASPVSHPWKLMSKLKDPNRFASFVEGGSHLNDSELLEYDVSNDSDALFSDDDGSGTEGTDSAEEDVQQAIKTRALVDGHRSLNRSANRSLQQRHTSPDSQEPRYATRVAQMPLVNAAVQRHRKSTQRTRASLA